MNIPQFIHLPTEGHLCHFQLSAITNELATNSHMINPYLDICFLFLG